MVLDFTECCINGQLISSTGSESSEQEQEKTRTYEHSFNACYFSIFELMCLQWCFSLL